MPRQILGPSVLVFMALLACKEQSQRNDPPKTAQSETAESPAPEEKLDKASVCALFGPKSDSEPERCSDCMDDAEMGACNEKAEAWGSCVGDVEKLASGCAGSCINQCVSGQKACCECTSDCVSKKQARCGNAYLAFQKCTVQKCAKSCS